MVCGTQQDNSHSIREDRVKFFVHKGGVKGLDCIASDQSRPGFYKFSFHHVLHFVFWDLMFNDTFVMCSSIFAQALGTAIGGSTSAQYASMVVAEKEIYLNSSSLPPIVRYRDNFLVLVLQSFLLHTSVNECIAQVLRRLTETIRMNLTLEGVTPRRPFLEAMVFVTSNSTFSPNSRDMLSSYVPNQIAKCTHYAHS